MIGSMLRGAATILNPLSEPLLKGTKELGYYGRVKATEFIGGYELVSIMGTTVPGAYLSPWTDWLKFSLNGKTLYVTMAPMSVGAAWDTLVQRNLIDGSRKVSFRGHTYKVRLLDGGVDAEAESEWNKLMYPVRGVGDVWDTVSVTDFYGYGSIRYGSLTTPFIDGQSVSRGFGGDVRNHALEVHGADNQVWRPCLELVE